MRRAQGRKGKPESSRPLILLGEDDPEIRELLQKALDLDGFDVVACENGTVTASKARRGSYDLVLVDFRMPGKTGLTVLRELRNAGIDTPLLLMACDYPDGVRSELRRTRSAGALPKPFTLARLRSAVTRALSRTSSAPSRS